MFDAVVVGGGAAGMMAAITAAERGKHVLLLEKNAQLGRKIRITGKGRCNVTNNCEPRTVIESTPGNGRFLYGAVNHFTPQDTMDFFEGLGVPLKTERGNRVFPVSDNAHDIADALWKKLKKCRVEIRQGNVKEVLTENGSVIGVRTENDAIEEIDDIRYPVIHLCDAVCGKDTFVFKNCFVYLLGYILCTEFFFRNVNKGACGVYELYPAVVQLVLITDQLCV